MNKAQEIYWKDALFMTADNGETARALRLVRAENALMQQDAQIERLARRVADAELELDQTLRVLRADNKEYLRLMNRICDALGTWVGKWDDAAIEAIKRDSERSSFLAALAITEGEE